MLDQQHLLSLGNGEAIERRRIPNLPWALFRQTIATAFQEGGRISAFFGDVAGGSRAVELYALLTDDAGGQLRLTRTTVEGEGFASLTPEFPQVHLFEREVAEQFGLRPEGHPWLKPVRFQKPYRPGPSVFDEKGQTPLIGVTEFYRVEGQDIHEVAVGPVHAGIIEPGHFRFQCYGENVFHLEISLGYQHRGIERMMIGGPNGRALHAMQTVAGDTTIGHATAYCQILETLSGSLVPPRAQALRGIGLELERIANHVGDLGALSGDVAFLPTASYCGRLRGDFLNMTALLCGSRFGRGLLCPGGVEFDVDEARSAELLKRLDAAAKDVTGAINLLWDTPSVMARFEETGAVPADLARQIGLVGPAARACGLDQDIRRDLPLGIFRFSHLPVSTWHTGDVFARAYVRWLEVQQSIAFIRQQLQSLPSGEVAVELPPLKPDQLAAALVEGWRGEICHVAMTDAQGRLGRYKIVDPSFHNWYGLACALRGQQISDFPLCNKSFNLSYCGHDL